MNDKKWYVVAESGTGRVLTNIRKSFGQHGLGKIKVGVYKFPNKNKPILFGSLEKAEAMSKRLFDPCYVREAKSKELKWVEK